jgi:hypothetical protein
MRRGQQIMALTMSDILLASRFAISFSRDGYKEKGRRAKRPLL